MKSLAAEVYTARAHRELFECVSRIVERDKGNVDLSQWSLITETRLKQASHSSSFQSQSQSDDKAMNDIEISSEDAKHMNDLAQHTNTETRKRFEHGFVTIGCCG